MRSVRHWATAMVVALLPQLVHAAFIVVGPVFPPPGGHSFVGSGTAGAGDISRAAGQTFTISTPLGSRTAVYFGPQPNGVALSFSDPSFSSGGEILTYDPSQSNLQTGLAVWTGTTHFADGFPVWTRFRVQASDASSGFLVPQNTAVNLGLPASIGALSGISTPPSGLVVSNHFEASLDNVNFAPALDVFDAYHGGKTSAFSSYTYGYYYVDTAPLIQPIAAVHLAVGSTAVIPVVYSDAQSDTALLTLTLFNNNPGLLAGAVVIGAPGANSVQVTRANTGAASLRLNVSDGSLSTDIIIQVLDDFPPTIAPIPNTVMEKNTAILNLPITVGDDLTAVTDLVVTATSGNQLLVSDANLAVNGTGSLRSIFIGPFTDAFGTTTITVHANDGHQVATTSFLLTVDSPPRLDTNTGLVAGQGSTTPIMADRLRAIDLDDADNQIIFTLDFAPHAGSLQRLGLAMAQGAHFTQQDVDDGSIAYMHDNSCGVSDNFGISARDGKGGVMRDGTFTSFTFNIAVVQTNLPPVAVGQSLQVPLAGTANGTLTATNSDCIAPTYTFSIATVPTKGTLTLLSTSTGAFTYAASAGQVGADSFTFNVNDGVLAAVPGTVSITISNTAPSLSGQALSASEDGAAVTGTAVATDPDLPPQTMTYRVGTDGAKGTATVNGMGSFSYLPSAGRMGTDSFTVIANDGITDSAPAAFIVEILPKVALGRYAVVATSPAGIVLFDPVTGDAGLRAPLSGTNYRGITYGAAGLVAVNATTNSLDLVGAGSVAPFGSTDPSPPFGPITVDTDVGGNLVVAQGFSGIGRYAPDGTPLAGYSGGNLQFVTAVSVGADGDLYAADSSNFGAPTAQNSVVRIHPADGTQTLLASGGSLDGGVMLGMVAAADGTLYATLGSPGGPGGSVVKIAGNSAVTLSTGGALASPAGIAFDASGNLVVANANDGALIAIDRLAGTQTLLYTGPRIAGAFGLDRIAAFAVAPDVPASVVATAGVAQATVSFAPPANDGGSAITGYTVTSSPQGHTTSGTGSPLVVTALDNGVPYTFTVTATSAAGTSAPSAPSNTVTPRTVPDAPTSVSALAGNGQATVSFQPPAFNGGAAISGYTVSCTPGPIQATGAVSPVVVQGLANGTQYSCTVVATNIAGDSVSSAAATVTPLVPFFTLTVAKAGAGNGTVTSTPAGIACGATCASDFANGTLVTLSASAGALSTFTGWSGACAGNGACNVAMDAARSATATFAQVATLSVTPPALDFGGTSFGTTSPTHIVSVLNNGGATIHVTTMSIDNAQFAQVNTCATLAAGASCEVDLAFTPAPNAAVPFNGTMPAAATLTITSDASASPHTVSLAGIGEKSLVTHYYRSILRREPDDGGKAFWQGESLRVAGLGANINETWFSMASSFYGSPEYAAFNRGDTAFITDLYTTFFNRPPDNGGLGFWSSQLAAGLPREVLLASFEFSPEFGTFTQNIFGNTAARPEVDVVLDFYRGILSRLPDSGGFAFWLQRFRTAQCAGAAAVVAQVESISSSFTQSGEYIGRNRSGAQFVGDVYNAFLRRGGDLAGVQFWVNQVNGGTMTRETVRRNFLASPEFNARVAAISAASCLP